MRENGAVQHLPLELAVAQDDVDVLLQDFPLFAQDEALICGI